MKWEFRHGIHKGTLMSRDVAETQRLDTESAALKYYEKQRKLYRRSGYQIWYAKLMSPNGEERTLEQNPYR